MEKIRMKRIILASGSPRRKQLLSNVLKDFECILADDEKNISKILFSYELIENIAKEKVNSVYSKIKDDNAIIIGADTVVVLDDKILTKPKDFDDAFNTLKFLSNRTHYVITSHVIKKGNIEIIKSVRSDVTFNLLKDEDIIDYINTKKPYDKAGAYGIQELPKHFVKEIKGELNNIIGFSTIAIKEMLDEIQNY